MRPHNTTRIVLRRQGLAALVLALCAACASPAPAQDRLSRYRAQFDAESNPARRARLLGQMGSLVIAEARTTFKAGQDEQALEILTRYSDDVNKGFAALTATGVDAVRRPSGFKELQIGLRTTLRHLDDMIVGIPVEKRPWFREARAQLSDVENKLIDLLFPSIDKNATRKE